MVCHICLCSPAGRTPCISLTVSHYRSICAPQASARDSYTLKNHIRALSHTGLNINCHSSGQRRCTLLPTEMVVGNSASQRSVRGHTLMRWENEKRRKVREREKQAGLCDCDSLEFSFRSKSLGRWKWFSAVWKMQHFPLSQLSTTMHLLPCALFDLSPLAGTIISE